MAYRFIEQNKITFGLRWLLNRMNIFPNAYYNYALQTKAESQAKKEVVCREIKEFYHETGGILGHRSIRIFLARNKIFLSKATIHKYMNKEMKLYCVCCRRRPDYKKDMHIKYFRTF